MKKYVVGFAFNADKDYVVLIQKNKPEWQKGSFNGVGGKIEDGETPQEAMAREFKEEAGIYKVPDEWQEVGLMTGEDWECHVFTIADDSVMDAGTMTDEEIGVMPVIDVIKGDYQVISNLPFLIELCRDEHRPKIVNVAY